MSAVFSPCGTWRYKLGRKVADVGPVYGYFGVNGATAGVEENDHTVCKWIGFTRIAGGREFIVGNPFAYCATDVRKLATAPDPIGPENDFYIRQIIAEADILVPCWGDVMKVPRELRTEFDILEHLLRASGKPLLTFGLTKNGDPKHPLMLPYSTQLQAWPEL